MEVCLPAENPARLRREARECARAGVARLELCARLDIGGLTPSPAAVGAARQGWGDRPGVLAMLRPADGFATSPGALPGLIRQMDLLAAAGADGVVLGFLRGRQLDLRVLRPLAEHARARGLSLGFHRAIDQVDDVEAAVSALARLGFQRLLASGTPWGSGRGALDGLPRLGRILRAAGGDMELVLGGGIHAGILSRLRKELPRRGALSVHAYSSVRRDGRLDARLLAALASAARHA